MSLDKENWIMLRLKKNNGGDKHEIKIIFSSKKITVTE